MYVQGFCKAGMEDCIRYVHNVHCGLKIKTKCYEVIRPRGSTSQEAEPRSLEGSQGPVLCEILARTLGFLCLNFLVCKIVSLSLL